MAAPGDHATGGEPAVGHAYSHGEGTAQPDGAPPASDEHHTTGGDKLTDHIDPADIYGGKADVVGYEDEVEGADEDAVG